MADSSGLSGYVKVARAQSNIQVKYAKIDAASNGDNTLVAAVAGKRIRVLSLFYLASGGVNVRFESGAGGTALTGQMEHSGQTGVVLPHNEDGWFETEEGDLLNVELSTGVSIDGAMSYIEV